MLLLNGVRVSSAALSMPPKVSVEREDSSSASSSSLSEASISSTAKESSAVSFSVSFSATVAVLEAVSSVFPTSDALV